MNRVGSFWIKVLYALVAFMLLTLFFLSGADSNSSLSLIQDYKFLKGASKAEAEDIKKKLEEVGAKVTLK